MNSVSASSMYDRLYPGSTHRRRATLIADVLTMAFMVLFAWVGWRLYLRVDAITALALGVQHAGTSVQDGFTSVAGAVDGLPVVGSSLGNALTSAGGLTGGNVVSLGAQGETAIHRVAVVAGWLVFLLPSAVLLVSYLPGRVHQIRTASIGEQMLDDAGDPERQRLLAMRAAFSLPLEVLSRYTDDPIGDLQHGRHDRLLTALREDAGLRSSSRDALR
ncbi:MAG: hypothetical protein WAN48_01895 [Actinomycetes bacterium]